MLLLYNVNRENDRKNSQKVWQEIVFAHWVKTAMTVFAYGAAVRSIRKQEAAVMFGNGEDFHLEDAVIVAMLSVLLVMLMTDGFFVSTQIYFHSCQRKNTHWVHHYQVQTAWNETTPDMTVKLFAALHVKEQTYGWKRENVLAKIARSGSKQTLTWVSENVPSLPIRSYTIMA